MDNHEALIALADALDAAGRSLRASAAARVAPPAKRTQINGGGRALTRRSVEREKAVARARAVHPPLGDRQAEIIDLLDAAEPEGTDTGRLSRELSYDQPNVYLTLAALVRHGLAEKDSRTHPHTYRLGRVLRED